jgi:hypothetical protein
MPTTFRPGRQVFTAVALAVLAFGPAGCGGGLYPVTGTVTLNDGTPVTKGLVIFERVAGGEPLSARGQIRADGTYELSTHKPGDGVPPGRYKVVLNSMDLSDVPDEQKDLPYDTRYLSLKSSDLEFEVKAGSNEIPIRLAKSKKPRR